MSWVRHIREHTLVAGLVVGFLILVLVVAVLSYVAREDDTTSGDNLEHISQSLGQGQYINIPLDLKKGDVISVEISIEDGEQADFYLFDSENFQRWKGLALEYEACVPGTQQGASYIQYEAKCPETDTHYIVVLNPTSYGQDDIYIQGSILTTETLETHINPVADFFTSEAGLALLLVLILVVVLLIYRKIPTKKEEKKASRLAPHSALPGQNIKYICAKCKAKIPLDAKHCPNCGTGLAQFTCTACGKHAPYNAKHCPYCGSTSLELK